MKEKKLCPIHHYYYNGVECPLCLSERVNVLLKRNPPKLHKKDNAKEIGSNDIEKLRKKFNSR